MIEFLRSYAPLLDIFLMNCGFAFSQYVVLRSGVFSVATAGFAGLGAYTAGILAARHGFGPWVALPAATLVGLAAGILLSLPLARLRGAYQAIASLAFVQIVVALALYAERHHRRRNGASMTFRGSWNLAAPILGRSDHLPNGLT